MSVDEERFKRLEAQVLELAFRFGELERELFIDEDVDELDPLEAQYQQFAAGIRSKREGNA